MGVKASDVVKVMQDWIGTDKRKIIDLYNSHKPLAQGYAVKYTDAWCDTTVSACFITLNATDLIGGTECGVERHIQLFKKKGIWQEDGNVTPTPGAIICYNWDDGTQPNDGFADHIGIVEKIEGHNFTVIEGNFNNAVARRTIPVGWGYIRGYAFPKYDAESAPKPAQKEVSVVIDVSKWQGKIDWEKARKQIDGAILRCGYGSDLTSQDEEQWARNVAECERLGIPYGVYLFSHSINDGQSQSEINHCLRLIKGHKPTLGVFLDLENNNNGFYAKKAARNWCKQIAAAGYRVGIYCGAYFYKAYLNGFHEETECLWWMAAYGPEPFVDYPRYAYKPNPGFPIDAWQYSSVKRIDGIGTNVDINEWYADFEAAPGKVPSIAYRAHVQNKGWMSAVSDGAIAGTTGQALRLEAIKITPPDGVELEVDAHIQNIGWKTYKGIKKGQNSGEGSSPNDPIIGSVGKALRLEAVRIRCTKNSTGKKLKYQAHVQNQGWQPAVTEGMVAGTTGKSLRMEAIKIWFE